MAELTFRDAAACRYDIVSLGEVMLRLDPSEERIRTARSFRAWEGGGEYNVARGLSRCFRLRAGLVSALADNDVGRLIEDFILQGGVDTTHLRWLAYDGIGRNVRNGLNFTERGFGLRGAVGVSDRANSAASQIKPGDVDWDDLFGRQGVRWFHTGGIFAGLSESTAPVVIEAARAARKHGTVISYDLNYRPSLWKAIGGLERCIEVNREIARHVDVMLGDFGCLGYRIEGLGDTLEYEPFENVLARALADYPGLSAAAMTLRGVRSATRNDWGAVASVAGKFHRSELRLDVEVLDRVGGGDGFASGFIYGMMVLGDAQKAVDYGAAHGALAMTTPGDQSMASLGEVEKLVMGGDARIER